jgi:hypothetical protein
MTISNSMPQPSLNLELQQLVQEFSDWWTRHAEVLDAANEVRQPLFHYTVVASLRRSQSAGSRFRR